MSKTKILIITICSVVLLSGAAEARHRSVDSVIFNPASDGGKYITIHESSTLPQWRYYVGFYLDYAYQPLELRYTSGARRPVIDDMLMANVQAAIGFTDWLEMGINLPVVAWETYYNPDTDSPTKETEYGLGDLRLEFKFRVLDIERYHFGIAIIPFGTFPTVTPNLQSTADATLKSGWRNGKFASNESFTVGAKLALEGDIKNRVWLAVNAGYQMLRFRQYYTDGDAWVDDTFLLGIGTHIRITDAWRLIGEFYTETVAKPISNIFQSQRQTPLEGIGAVRFQPQNPKIRGMMFTLGGGRGITCGIGSPDLRVFFNFGYRKPKFVELPPPPPAIVDVKAVERIIITQKIHFEFNRSIIRDISMPILDDVAALLLQNPQIKMVEVAGHCDWIGGDQYNIRLSESRAKAVLEYLVGKGVSSSRLVAKGYGEGVPIADNNTTAGRAKNRRVEFTVLE